MIKYEYRYKKLDASAWQASFIQDQPNFSIENLPSGAYEVGARIRLGNSFSNWINVKADANGVLATPLFKDLSFYLLNSWSNFDVSCQLELDLEDLHLDFSAADLTKRSFIYNREGRVVNSFNLAPNSSNSTILNLNLTADKISSLPLSLSSAPTTDYPSNLKPSCRGELRLAGLVNLSFFWDIYVVNDISLITPLLPE